MTSLREQFPGFRIWREITGDRTRYIARSLHPGLAPHTVVTADPEELATILASACGQQPGPGTPPGQAAPNIARMYDYWTGGKDHFAADRHAADTVLADFPEVAQVARANREFVTRAVAHVATQGITQYLDIGAGLPAWPAVHQIAQAAHPAARTVYVDNDEIVLVHARALLATGPGVTVVPGDLRDTAAILASPGLRRLIDLGQPVCMILAAVLHFLTLDDASAAVAALTAVMAPGSYLILSVGTSTGTSPALIERLRAAYQGTTPISDPTTDQIAARFTGLDLQPPGLVDVWNWRPTTRAHWRPRSARIVGGVARKARA
jgi:hypothetical protein